MEENDDEKTPLLNSGDGTGYTDTNINDAKSKLSSSSSSTDSEKKEETKNATFAELFAYATCLDKFLMFWGCVFSLGTGAAWPLMTLIFGQMTNDFIRAPTDNNTSVNNTNANMTLDEFEERMTTYAIYYCIIGGSVFILSSVQVASWSIACERQVHKIRRAFFCSILRQEQGWFDKHQSGELTTRLADDLERIREGMGDKFSLCLQFVAQCIAGFVIGFIKSWKLTLVIMSLTPVLAICASFLSKTVSSFSKREQTSYAGAGSVAEEVLSCIRTVTSFNGQKQEIKRYAKSLEEGKKLGIKKATVIGLGLGTTFFFMFGAYALAFWYGTSLVNDYNISGGTDGIDPGTVMTVFFCVMIGSMALGNAGPHASAVATAKGAAAVVLEIIKRVPPIDSTSDAGMRPDSVKGQIDFVGVDFSYPTREKVKVLKNFNISIKPGQTVALVGSSGCGKSTTVNMIQRFYDPSSGSVYLDGHNVKDLNIKWLRQNIGVVSQEPILFGRSIAENIQLGKLSVTHDQIVDAAKAANIHDFINGLPKGYETLVGERGAQLSGGQKQRVAIARALVRNPRILLLDEATSALDSQSEKSVQDALEKAREGRTTVVVAHRLSTIQNADLIYVLENGVLVEQGKHGELMSRQGVYHQLVTLQTIAEMKDGDEDEMVNEVIGKLKDKTTKRSVSRHLSRQESKTKKDEVEEEEEEPAVKPSFLRLMRENTPECAFIVMGCCAAALNGCLMPLFAFFLSAIIQTFGYYGQKLKDEGLFWSLMFLALGVGTFFINLIQNISFGTSGERLTARLRLQSFRSIIRQEVSYFDDPKHSTGALATRLATDASMVKNGTGIRLGIIIQSAVSLIAGLAIGFVYGWKLAFVILAAVPIMAVAGAIHMKALTGGQKRDAELLEEAGKTSSEAIENARTVQSLTQESHFYDRYCQMLLVPHKMNIRHAGVYSFAYGFSQAVIFLLYAGAFRFGAYLVATGDMAPDKVFRVFFAIAFTGMSAGQAASFLPDYSKAKLSAAFIFKILDMYPVIDSFSARGQRPVTLSGEIELRNVEFKYPLRPDVKVLQGLSLQVRPGQTAALVGVSGCGKSTVISLIQRYYDPLQGEILIDGVPIQDMHLLTLRSFISVVSQEPILFDCSIRDNICYGLDRDVSMTEVIEAARTANAHDFVNSLPLGYDTMVGEKGTQLSGGQKQRVAIARALVRNPRILLLDEATSALDSESEKVVQTALDNAQEGRTCIVVAHRLSTIQNADIIYVIENGLVIEQGTHQELLEKDSAYAKLVKGQQFKS